jgi:hypothetical protein
MFRGKTEALPGGEVIDPTALAAFGARMSG